MKGMILAAVIIGTVLVRAASGDGLTQKLQQGLFEEEANRNLEAAIKNYDAVVQQADEQRRVVATAVFRLAECYRKLGRTNEATRYYQRVLRDFSEQEQLVKASRAVLGAEAQHGAQADGSSPSQPLTQAEADELAKVKSLVQNSPDLVNAASATGGSSPLQTAAAAGHYHVCQYLLDHGADPNVGATPPIIRAAARGHLRIVELLLSKGADVNATTSKVGVLSETALMYAAANGFRSVVELLLKRGADVNRTDAYGWTAVHSAVTGGDTGVLALLLDRKPNLNQTTTRAQWGDTKFYIPSPLSTEQGVTALHLCGPAGKSELAKLLLEKGNANVNATNSAGETPLFWAAAAGQTNTMAVLLSFKANPNVESSYGETPLLLAIRNNFPAAIRMLLMHGAEVNKKLRIPSRIAGNDGGSKTYAIHLAENRAVLDAILSGKPRLDVTNSFGQTLAQLFVRRSELLDGLLDAGADPNANYSAGLEPPLVYAVDSGNLNSVRTLLTHGAKANITWGAAQQFSPLHVAETRCKRASSAGSATGLPLPPPPGPGINPQDQERYCEIAKLLREHGADPHLLRRRSISFGRQETDLHSVFATATNDWNRYTLFEALAFGGGDVPNPALAEAYISRLTNDATTRVPVNLTALLSEGCTNDVWLNWGDALVVPYRDYKLGEPVSYMREPDKDALVRCLTREVTIIVKGTTNSVRLIPRLTRPSNPGNVLQSGLAITLGEDASENTPRAIELQMNNFRLKDTVLGSNLLRASSDQTSVRVTRVSPENRTTNTWVVDLTTIPQNHNLWVRAGDVIEIPERK